MKKENTSNEGSNQNTRISLDRRSITICPWCYNVTDFKSEKTFTCKICKRQITPEDLIEYQLTKEGE